MRTISNRIFSAFLSLMLFSVFNLCAVENISASISSKLPSRIQLNHQQVDDADGHPHHSDTSHDHDGSNQDENCCSNVLAIQIFSGVSSVKNLILKPVVSWAISLPGAFQYFSNKLSQRSEFSFDSDSSPPTLYRATYSSHAPPLHV